MYPFVAIAYQKALFGREVESWALAFAFICLGENQIRI